MKTNFNNNTYSSSFKENAVKQLLMSGSCGLTATSVKIGVPPSTLYGWKKKYAINMDMKTTTKSAFSWTLEQKLDAVIKTASLSEQELGEYLRQHGLHTDDLARFKRDLTTNSLRNGKASIDPEMVELRRKNKVLEKDIKRKDKALAEYSARVILLKKSHEIWGEPEEEESPNWIKK